MSFSALVAAADRAAQAALGGEAVTYAPEVGDPVEVTGIFDESYVLAKSTGEAGVVTLGPAVSLLLADLPIDPKDDEPTITIGGVDYRVSSEVARSMGNIVLALRRVA